MQTRICFYLRALLIAGDEPRYNVWYHGLDNAKMLTDLILLSLADEDLWEMFGVRTDDNRKIVAEIVMLDEQDHPPVFTVIDTQSAELSDVEIKAVRLVEDAANPNVDEFLKLVYEQCDAQLIGMAEAICEELLDYRDS